MQEANTGFAVSAESQCRPTADATLVAAVLVGRHTAFEDLVRRYERSARAICYAVLGDWHLAEDTAQDGFIAAYNNLRSLREPSSFGPWLLTIMRHRARRVASSQQPIAPLHLVAEPEMKTAMERDDEALFAAISRLPKHEHAMVMFRYFDGYDIATIAVTCDLPVGTVTKRLSRAHQRLRKFLEKGERQ